MKILLASILSLISFLLTHAQNGILAPIDSVELYGARCGGVKMIAQDTFYFAFCAKADSVVKVYDHQVVEVCPYFLRNLQLNCQAEYCTLSEFQSKPRWKKKGALLLADQGETIIGLNMQCTDLNVYDRSMHLLGAYPLDFPFLIDGASYFHNYFASRPIQIMGDRAYVQLLMINGLGSDGTTVPKKMPLFGMIALEDVPITSQVRDTLSDLSLKPTAWFGVASKRISSRRLSYFYGYFASFATTNTEGKLFYNDGLQAKIQVFDPNGNKLPSFGIQGTASTPRPTFRIDKASEDSIVRDFALLLNTTQYFGLALDTSTKRLFVLYNEGILASNLSTLITKGALKSNRDFEHLSLSRPTHLQVYSYSSRRLLADVPLGRLGTQVLGVDSKGLIWISGPMGRDNVVGAFGYRL